MGYILDGYKIMGQELKENVAKNRSNILTGISVAGTIANGIISARAGAKGARKIDAEQERLGRALTLKEKAKLCWTDAIAPVGTTIIAGGSAIGSRAVDAKTIGELTTLYVGTRKLYSEFRKATKEVIGEKKNQELQDHIAEERAHENISAGRTAEIPACSGDPSTMQKFYLPFCDLVFYNTMDKVKLGVSNCREIMQGMRPRATRNDNYTTPAEYGVRLNKLFEYWGLNCRKSASESVTLYEHYGFNKGYWDPIAHCSNDDNIDVYFTSTILQDDTSAIVITFDEDPSDMRQGDLLKS